MATAAVETARQAAMADPSLIVNAAARAQGATRDLHRGQPPEVVDERAREAGASLFAAVIRDRLSRNDPLGLTLLAQYADRLGAPDRSALGAAARMMADNSAAAEWVRTRTARLAAAPTGDAAVDAVNAASASSPDLPPPVTSSGGMLNQDGMVGYGQRLAEIGDRRRALAALNEQEFAGDPARLQANRRAIDSDAARKRAAVKAEADEIYAGLDSHMRTGGPGGGRAVTLPPPTILSRLTEAQQDAVAAQVDRAIEGKKTRTDPVLWYAINQGLTGDDANEREQWADTNLVQFRGRLSDEDFAALTKLQNTVRGNDGGAEATRLQAITRMTSRALLEARVDPTPTQDRAPHGNTARAATFRRAVDDELLAFESSKGRPATAVDAQAIVGGLATRAFKGGWLEAANQNDFLIKALHIPSAEDEVFLAQAEPDDDKPSQGRSGTAPLPELPEEITERLRPDQKEDIEGIIATGADTPTDPDTLKKILLGLTSKDREERLKWAREPLFQYRSLLSPEDFGNLVEIQHNMSPHDGVPIGGTGSPIGTLNEAADLLATLRGGPLGEMALFPWGQIAKFLAREAHRAGRWAWNKIKGKDQPPPSKNVPASEEPKPTGAVAIAAKAVEAARSALGAASASNSTEKTAIDQPRNFGKNPKDSDVAKGIQEAREEARNYRAAYPLGDVPDVAGFTTEEARMIEEGRRIYSSPRFSTFREGYLKGEVVVGNVEGQVVQYEPTLPANIQGMSSGGDIAMGPSAFRSNLEVARTIAQELYRLRMDQTGWASAQHATDAHIAARDFANRAGGYIIGRSP